MIKIFSQIMGLTALIFWLWSIQKKNKEQILKLQVIANIFYSIQYFTLGVPAAGLMNLISIIRNIVYNENSKKNTKNQVWMLVVFIILILFIGIITFDNYLNIVPITLTLLYTYITWQKNTAIIRCGFIIAALIWIFYNAFVGAYVSLCGNLLELTFGFISVARFDLKRKKSE